VFVRQFFFIKDTLLMLFLLGCRRLGRRIQCAKLPTVFLPRMNQKLLTTGAQNSQQDLTIFNKVQNSESQKIESNEQTPSSKMTHFGFQEVPREHKATLVKQVFHSVAEKYDLMNDVMSVGIHRLWKDRLMQQLSPVPGTKLVDVAGGTGDIAARFVSAVKSSPLYLTRRPEERSIVTVVDINPKMLEVGKARFADITPDSDPTIVWMEGDAEQLPLASDSMDAYTIAFGIRNCTNPERVIQEAYRVLRKGGRFLCLEFSRVPNGFLRTLYDAYSFNVIPLLGQLIAGDRASYQYLVESIRQFPDQEAFKALIEQQGFKAVTYTNLTFGIAAIHSAFKL